MSKTMKIVLIILLVVILIGLGLIYYFFIYTKGQSLSSSPGANPSSEVSTSSKIEKVTDPGVNWIEPVPLDDLGLLKVGESENIGEVKYYRIATLDGGGELILAVTQFNEPSLGDLLRFKKDAQGKYFFLSKQSTRSSWEQMSKNLGDKVEFDYNTSYQSLTPPAYLTVKDTTLKQSSNVGIFSSLKNPQEIAETAYGKIYQLAVGSSDSTELGGVAWSLRLADSTFVNYTIKFSFITDDEVAKITWSDGSKNSLKYTAEGYAGCAMSASNNVILKTSNISSRLTEAGKTDGNENVFTLSKDDPIIQKAYENYKAGRQNNVVSIDEFVAKKAVFVIKSPLGVYVIFTARDYGSQAECGKPVIYLYPETPTNVTVKVGAQITKSEPAYDNGWNVSAFPDGTLSVANKIYDYLFWEGKGQDYPLSNSGTIVKKQDVAPTIRMQLSKLGLNNKESNDFLEFWLPKMPDKPYVRLTWLGTSDMNKLAPLYVDPKPDTIIRVFLDFEGLNVPITLTPQNLSSIPRNGFTLIEWGGLLREQ